MMFDSKICGVIAAALTPLKTDLSPAYSDLPVLLDFLAKRGCHGALLLGTTGEGPSFSPEERVEITRAALVIRGIHPDFKLLVGTGTPSIQETCFLNKAVFDLGADGVVVLPPYFFRKVQDEGLFEWYSRVIEGSVPVGSTFLIYHIPSISGISFSLEFIERLVDRFPDRNIGIKDSSAEPEFARELGARFGGELAVFNGTDSIFDLALENGAVGCITALANLCSPDLRMVWEARRKDQIDYKARSRLEIVRGIMNRFPPNPPLYKGLIYRMYRFPFWPVRPPLLDLDEKKIDQILAETSNLVPEFAA